MKTFLKLFFVTVLVAMLGVTVNASRERSLFEAGAEIWDNPWGKATLFDTYFAFLTVFIWMAYRESGWIKLSLWFIAVMLLGNFAIAGYFLHALWKLGPGESWHKLFEPAD